MTIKCKPTHFFFCFHPKFDTGTWSVAAAFTSAVLFSAMFVMTLSYAAPKCACPQIWEHIDILPTAFKVMYVTLLLYFITTIAACFLAIYGTCKAQHKKLPFYIVTMIFTELIFFGMSIFIFIQLGYLDQYLLFDNETYWKMARLVLKEDLMTSLEVMMGMMTGVLKQLLGIDLSESLNLDMILDAALKEEVLVILGGMKSMMKVSAILMILGINWLFVTSILVVGSHYRRLRLNMQTTVSGLRISKLMPNSARSTASESVSGDCSGTPLKQLKQMRSKDYRSSSFNSKKIYDLDKFDVEDKFPRGGYL